VLNVATPTVRDARGLRTWARFICLATMWRLLVGCVPAEDFTNALQAILHQRVEVERHAVGMVVGLVDEEGTRIVSCGKMDNGTDQGVDGDTLFELGSITKTFTALLLQDMVERGEMRLEEPVAKYLPPAVKVPTHNGKPITLLHLATHTSGLPFLPKNLHPKRMENPYADYTVDQLYAFLSSFQLTRDPGTQWEYSEVGMQLLGQAISLKAGTNYEALLVERICRPLGMESTRVRLTPELRGRLATGHNQIGCVVPGMDFHSLVGGSALHSSANDLLRYISANLGLSPCRLTPLMQRMQTSRFPLGGLSYVGLTWILTHDLPGTDLVYHGGETFGHTAWIGFDKSRKRGVVVLASSSPEILGVSRLGWLLLESEWRPANRPQPEVGGKDRLDDSGVGQYQLAPSFALGVFTLRTLVVNWPKLVMGSGVGLTLVLVLLLVWRAAHLRKLKEESPDDEWRGRRGRWPLRAWRRCRGSVWWRRTVRLSPAVAVFGAAAAVVIAPQVASRLVAKQWQMKMGVRREGERLMAQLIQSTVGLLPQSKNRYFERMTGMPLEFLRDTRGKVNRLVLRVDGTPFTFEKTSEKPPEFPKPRVAIKLEPRLNDSYLGRYEFAPDEFFPDGLELKIRRQGEGLAAEGSNTNGTLGAVAIYPTSETNFCLAIGVELNFEKNAKGEVTGVTRQAPGWPDSKGKKLGDAGPP